MRDEWFEILQQQCAADAVQELHTLGLLRIIAPPLDGLTGPSGNDPGKRESFCHALATVRATEQLWADMRGNSIKRTRDIPAALLTLAPHIRGRYQAYICDERTYLALLKCAALLHNVHPLRADNACRDTAGSALTDQAAAIAVRLGRQWHCSNREVHLLGNAVRYRARAGHLAQAPSLDRRTIFRYYRDAGEYGVDAALLALADALARRAGLPPPGWVQRAKMMAELLAPFLEGQTDMLDPTPLLSGRDLVDLLHLNPGPQIGEILAELREEQAAGTVHTREAALAWVRAWAVSRGRPS
jgi:hypothetical protein